MLPNSPLNAKVGILGGSFDPPHLGHTLLALSALATTPIDEVWVMPCAAHAFQKPLTSFEHRIYMCEQAFSQLKNVHIVDIEQKLPTPNFTIATLEEISKLRPDLNLSLVMGSDLMDHFDTWEGADDIRKLAKLNIFDRKALLPGAQSTQIRQAVKQQDFSHLDLKVRAYIQKHNLYA
ncbi:MAG: nicotinate-nicotinamide nucleotide adenylyltransferase [Myxococcota bacterium]